MKCGLPLHPVGLLKFIHNLFRTMNIPEGELFLGDFINYVFNIGLCSDAFEPISYQFGLMLDMTEPFSSVLV